MVERSKSKLTQRAYTLRLQGEDPNDHSWRDTLWHTHNLVNKGAKAFGDWLLTLRGGIDHRLVEQVLKNSKFNRQESDDDGTHQRRVKSCRILLALSWLSVESRLGAPTRYIVADGNKDRKSQRQDEVLAEFKKILKKRGLKSEEIREWEDDCRISLRAPIRDDAVWVNRSAIFDDTILVDQSSPNDEASLREAIWDMLERFLGTQLDYLDPPESENGDEKFSNQALPSKIEAARTWLSQRFGTGKKADFLGISRAYNRIAEEASRIVPRRTGEATIATLVEALQDLSPKSNDVNGILGLISTSGRKSAASRLIENINDSVSVNQDVLDKLIVAAKKKAKECEEKISKAGRRKYSDIVLRDVESVCGVTYLVDKNNQAIPITNHLSGNSKDVGLNRTSGFAVMLDHAARRVSSVHTWIRRAEAERRNFEIIERKMSRNFPQDVGKILDEYCQQRLLSFGALEPYRIRRRAIEAWPQVVVAWSKYAEAGQEEERIKVVKELQDDPEIPKFGDVNLFKDMAGDRYRCVWHRNGDIASQAPDHGLLVDYVKSKEARFNQERFKVPSYCHPDACLHPVFCDFGKSRCQVGFDIHKIRKSAEENAKKSNLSLQSRGLFMELWKGSNLEKVKLRWQSKRLASDLAIEQGAEKSDQEIPEVSRSDRLSRAAVGVSPLVSVSIADLFGQKDWNSRLQAPRRQMEDIAKLRDSSLSDQVKKDRMHKEIRRIRWFVTFSAELRTQGPWLRFAKENNNFVQGSDSSSKFIFFRATHTPGLRVLSVDLGHRCAAACAVWETLNTDQVVEVCKKVKHRLPEESDVYLNLKGKDNGKERTTIYRRIASDTTVPEGEDRKNEKPRATWARLERQFFIKLQGEGRVREASVDEMWFMHRLEEELGCLTPFIDKLCQGGWGHTERQRERLDGLRRLGWRGQEDLQNTSTGRSDTFNKPSLSVDEMMFSLVCTYRAALRDHGIRARIAHSMTADYTIYPGDRKYHFNEAKGMSANDDAEKRMEKHIESVQNALFHWYELIVSGRRKDDRARELWQEFIERLPDCQLPTETDDDLSPSERKKKRKAVQDKLKPAAEFLLQNLELRRFLHEAWKQYWEEDDRQWKRRLRELRNWIFPRGSEASKPSVRHTGGLSLTRIAAMREFRQKVQVAFFDRPRPNDKTDKAREGFGKKTMDAFERLRDQRVKQLASRIAEAALGIGRMRQPDGGRDIRRPRESRDKPCHAVVIENLTNYRPDETRPRRENRQLMSWASSKVKKYLDDSCELNGLFLVETGAAYTSRQDSRTGAPGMRCQDISVCEFMTSAFWKRQIERAEEKKKNNQGDSRERLLCALYDKWNGCRDSWDKAGNVRIPVKGGEIFVSAEPNSPARKGLHADLNAAANIGLKALLDPDWPGRWWYVACYSSSFRPLPERTKGSQAIDPKQPLANTKKLSEGKARESGKKKKMKSSSKTVVNLWRDISHRAISKEEGSWYEYAVYKNLVQCRVVNNLRAFMGLEKDSQ